MCPTDTFNSFYYLYSEDCGTGLDPSYLSTTDNNNV